MTSQKNWPMLAKVADFIIEHPELHKQGAWIEPDMAYYDKATYIDRASQTVDTYYAKLAEVWKEAQIDCGTAFCFAGHGVNMAGGVFINSMECLMPGPIAKAVDGVGADERREVRHSAAHMPGAMPVRHAARRVFGLTADEAGWLFNGGLSRGEIAHILLDWAAEDGYELSQALRDYHRDNYCLRCDKSWATYPAWGGGVQL